MNKVLYYIFSVLFFGWFSFLIVIIGSFIYTAAASDLSFYEVYKIWSSNANPLNTNIALIVIFVLMFTAGLKAICNYYEKKF